MVRKLVGFKECQNSCHLFLQVKVRRTPLYRLRCERNQFLDQAGGFKEKMDKAEASKILSVSLDANEKEINQAFRQLMIANHPDKGGSRYISEKGTIPFQNSTTDFQNYKFNIFRGPL